MFQVMRLKRATFQTCAFWLAGPFVAAAVIEPLVNQTLKDHGVLKRPENWVWAMIVLLAHAFAARWFEILTGFVAGVSVGSWVDALLRRRETIVPVAQPPAPSVSKVSDLKAEDHPINLRLQFSGNHEAPVGLHQQNVLAWYVTWAHEFTIEGTKE